MTITIPKPLVVLAALAAVAATVYIVYEEVPAMYRYLFKFEAM
jgi:hypothetical protein